uniref:Lipid scramblase CLPTM1L n=1 Tax=Stegastes partitus TaxID=144197 RepID=A0A3B4Z3U3_9TELE
MFPPRSSVAKLLLGVFVVYSLHTGWLLYGFLNTKPCDGGRGENCISSYLAARPRLQMSVFTCLLPDNSPLIHLLPRCLFVCRQVNISLPEETRANGTLFAVVYVHKAGVSPLEDSREVHYAAQLTTYILPPHAEVRQNQIPVELHHISPSASENPVSHWRPLLSITMMSEDFTFNKAGLPSDVRRYMRVSQDGRQMIYLPLLLVNELSCRVKDLVEISSSSAQLPLTVSYEGISLRGFRFWVHLQDMVYSLRQFGFTEENIDEIKETLLGSNLYLLVLTALVTALQLICEFLALKNDISSWRKKKSMAGMSRKSVLWRSLSTLLIFLHLLEETSLLVLLPVGLGASVEVWKLFKVFKIQLLCKSNKLHVNKLDEEERRTVEFDAQACRYLSYLVYPLCISGAVFSLWIILNEIHQLFKIHFKLLLSLILHHYKYTHLHQFPEQKSKNWITLISKLTTFSSSHQLSCFRDELLFLLYLYQRRYETPECTRNTQRKAAPGFSLKLLLCFVNLQQPRDQIKL